MYYICVIRSRLGGFLLLSFGRNSISALLVFDVIKGVLNSKIEKKCIDEMVYYTNWSMYNSMLIQEELYKAWSIFGIFID